MVSTTTLADTLRCYPALAELETHQLEKLAERARDVRFQAGDIIFQEGDGRDDFYLIVSGAVALEIRAAHRTIRIQTLMNGEELGWSSALAESRKHFQARALKTVHALAFEGEWLREYCDEDPAFGYNFTRWMLTVVAQRLQATQLQLLDLYGPSVTS
jgi:CRP-like cAMP-binding protein